MKVLRVAIQLLVITIVIGCGPSPRLMWGAGETATNANLIHKIIGTSAGEPLVGFMVRKTAVSTPDIAMKLVTSEWPHGIYINGQQVYPKQDTFILFVNTPSGEIRRLEFPFKLALQVFGLKAPRTDASLGEFWTEHIEK